MAGKFTTMASTGMGEEGGALSREPQGGGLSPPEAAIRETQLNGQACEAVKLDNDNGHLHMDLPAVHTHTYTCDAGHEGAAEFGISQGRLHAASSTPLAWQGAR